MTKLDYNAKLESLRLEMLIKRLIRLTIVLAVILSFLEFIVGRHGKIALENLPLFPAVFALMATALIVGLAYGTRYLLGRGDDYYGDHVDD